MPSKPKPAPEAPTMANEYINLIAGLDKVISEFRTLWMESKISDDTLKWKVKLDDLLDERMRLMKARDAAMTVGM